jgi:hypothetical protein
LLIVSGLGGYVPIILQRCEIQFQRAIHKAGLSVLNRKSPINGLAPIHFAVLWPAGLKILIDKGVDVNVEDCHGRQPIHLAVALGHIRSVEYLINADCALSSPSHDLSLLQHAMKLRDPQRQQILEALVSGLTDRHTRLLDMASELLPSSSLSKLNIAKAKISERAAPDLIILLETHGISVPEALELDGKGVYDFSDNLFSSRGMTPDVAKALWEAGFKDINEPNENGLTPMLQSWFTANFEMVAWFAGKGVPLSSEHRDAPLTTLHVYAKGFNYTRGSFPFRIPTDKHHVKLVQKELGIPYDKCTCPCSQHGCSPAKFLSRSQGCILRKWLDNMGLEGAMLRQYIFDFTRCLLFNYLGGKHTCCKLDFACGVVIRNYELEAAAMDPNKATDKPGRLFRERRKMQEDHTLYCLDNLPIPRKEAMFATDNEELKKTLDALMARFAEMPRPDGMAPEEEPFHFVRWIIAEGHVAIDVTYGCPHPAYITGLLL